MLPTKNLIKMANASRFWADFITLELFSASQINMNLDQGSKYKLWYDDLLEGQLSSQFTTPFLQVRYIYIYI
jgi:hypothetical protein